MKMVLVLVAVLVSSAAYAQSNPPMVGGKPLVQVRPKGASKAGAERPQPLAARLQACLEIEDDSKERLDCYDAVIAPKPMAGKRKQPAAKSVTECRVLKEQDERLACFNGFVAKLAKPST